MKCRIGTLYSPSYFKGFIDVDSSPESVTKACSYLSFQGCSTDAMRGPPLLRQHIISVLYFDITNEGDVQETPVPHPIRDRMLLVSSEKYLLRQTVLVFLL